MISETWVSDLCDLIKSVSSDVAEPDHQRDLIFGLWSCFAEAPAQAQSWFSQLEEDTLHRCALQVAVKLGRGAIPAHLTDQLKLDSQKAVVQSGAILLRALEECYRGLGALTEAPRHADSFKVSFRGRSGFLIPYKSVYRSTSSLWPRTFARRGLRYLRCIPGTLPTGQEIQLVWSRTGPAVGDELSCVGCFFEKLVYLDGNGTPIDDKTTGPFVVTALADERREIVAAGIEAAFRANPCCDVIVFPELSIPPGSRQLIQSQLRMKPWQESFSLAPQPTIVVAGSWHERYEDGRFRNVSHVYDGNGDALGCHEKNIPYSRDSLTEDIVASNKILVVATPTATFGFAICLDFCDVGQDKNAYDFLDVDFVLVPSLAGVSTMDGHRLRAELIWKKRKVGTFVVQQWEGPKKHFGLALACPVPGERPPISIEETVSPTAFRTLRP